MSGRKRADRGLTVADVRNMTEAALTRAQVAELMKIDPRTVTRAIESGAIPCVRFGRKMMIPRLGFLAVIDGSLTQVA